MTPPKKRIGEEEESEERLPLDWYGPEREPLTIETLACDEHEEYRDDPNV